MAECDIEKGKVDESASNLVKPGAKSTVEELIVKELRDARAPMLPECCIFRVPEVLRRQNKAAYEPNIVSIGPIHRGGKQFQLVEKVKKRCLTVFLVSGLNISLESLVKSVIEKLEQPARDYYAYTVTDTDTDTVDQLDQKKFVEMLILDGCYLIDLFLKGPVEEQQDEDDPIFNSSCMLEYLYHDLLLLENQLPWLVLVFFYDLIELGNAKKALSEVVIDFFKPVMAGDGDATILSNPKPESSPEIHHILDLIRTSLIQEEHQDQSPSTTISHLPHLIRTSLIQEEHQDQSPSTTISHLPQRIPSAATLLNGGVKFKKGRAGCILNIKFKNGVFTIPPVTIDEKTEPLFRNLIAYEQCFHSCKYRITSYAVLMCNLINTSTDVDILSEKGIVVNWLSATDASKLFNELYKDTTINEFNYRNLCNDVEQYRKSCWGRCKKKYICRLKIDYCYTPWATLSVFAAFVLLVLTFLQTIYTMLPSDPHPAPAPGR